MSRLSAKTMDMLRNTSHKVGLQKEGG
jgi:hypothetical protein